MAKLEIDMVWGEFDELADYGLSWTMIAEVGPAGGNPLVDLVGERSDIERYVRERREEAELYVGMIRD